MPTTSRGITKVRDPIQLLRSTPAMSCRTDHTMLHVSNETMSQATDI